MGQAGTGLGGAVAALQGPESRAAASWSWRGSAALQWQGLPCFLSALEVLREAIVKREGGNLATYSHS